MQFQIISCTYGNEDYGKLVIHLFGRDKDGGYVKSDIKGFQPYFYFKPNIDFDECIFDGDDSKVVSYEYVGRYLPSGYQTEKVEMIRVTVKKPGDVPQIRDMIIRNEMGEVFEADVLFPQRFLVDKDLGGMKWCQVENNEVIPIECEDDAPLYVMTFDIEVLPPADARIPDAKKDPCIMISVCINQPTRKSFVLIATKELPDELLYREDVICFDNESDMLLAFENFIKEYNPDAISGYNSGNFDFPYLIERFDQLIGPVAIGRNSNNQVIEISKFGAKCEVRISGRCCFDMMDIIKLNYSLDSYSLKVAAKELLKSEKMDVKASEMRDIWLSKDERLINFIDYSIRDSSLVMDFCYELRLLDRYIAISKVSGVQLQDAMNSGQMQRIESMLLRTFKKEDRVFPLRRRHGSEDEEEVKGAIVLEPSRGLHSNVIIMDFASLYPSAIRAYNISPDTIINDEFEGKTIRTPNEVNFVDHSVKMGIIPKILGELYQRRVDAKNEMKQYQKDDKLYEYYDNIQYSTKILLNSFYGYLGAKTSRLYDQRLANAVTAVGRDTLMKTKEIVESKEFDV
jgi:DNA polymerase, archaea type